PAHLGDPGLLTHLTRIRHVTIDGDIHPSDLRDVARLSGLKHLSIPVSPSFSTARLVSSSITDLPAVTPYHHREFREVTTWGRHLSAPSHCGCRVTTLEILSIKWQDDCARRVDAPIRAPYWAGQLAEITEPLLPLCALREVSLDFGGYDLEYTSRDVQALSKALPSLEELRLYFRTAIGPRSGIESLIHFDNCPHLHILHLPGMDAADDILTAAGTPAAPHPTLHELVIERVVFRGTDEAKVSAEMWQSIARQFPKATRHATIGPKD
ncbi:hypothetical protein BD309DRAFT_878903, partial [Dichomitus squalens]